MNEFDANEIMMVGDQTTTDVASGNNSGIKTLLTDPIVKEDQLRTRFNRIFDRYYRKTLLKNNELKDWREFYVKN
jgi:predicted HAD superfamily phosphohydrolase YqeG